MSKDFSDITGRIALHDASFAEVFPKKKVAYLSVPNRGSIKLNHAIGVCWVKFRQLGQCAKSEGADDNVVIEIDLTQPPFPTFDRETLDAWLEHFRHELSDWVHVSFYEHLRDNSYIFEGDEK